MLHEVPAHEAPRRLESFNPRDGSKLGEVPVADPAMVHAVFDRADEIARTVSSENGKPPVEPIALIAPVCEAIARRLRTGSVMVNNALQSGGCVTLPFGGDGDSGVGRAQGEQAYYHYVATKSVMTSPDSAQALWMPYASTTEGFFKGVGKLFNGRGIPERASGLVSLIRNRPRG